MDERKDQEVERAGRELEQQTDELQERTDKLGADIDSVRQEFQRKRNDESVPGLPPEPEADRAAGQSGDAEHESPADDD